MDNSTDMLKQFQEKMEDLKVRVGDLRIEGRAGGNAVKVLLDGNYCCHSVQVDPEYCNPEGRAVLEDLLTAAYNQAHTRVEQAIDQETKSAIAMGLPLGMKLPF